jgi:hypothetical protein
MMSDDIPSFEETLAASRAWQAVYDEEIRALCDRIGYGNVMSSASRLWATKCDDRGEPRSNFTVGPCEALTVPCSHSITDRNGHCEICCNAGWVTKGVADVLATPGIII